MLSTSQPLRAVYLQLHTNMNLINPTSHHPYLTSITTPITTTHSAVLLTAFSIPLSLCRRLHLCALTVPLISHSCSGLDLWVEETVLVSHLSDVTRLLVCMCVQQTVLGNLLLLVVPFLPVCTALSCWHKRC